PADADHDGLPDAWEKTHGLNPQDAADRAKPGAGGYPMLEVYLSELAGL
ncbi:MAG: pectate lyase, partial [Hymenobacter sp.]